MANNVPLPILFLAQSTFCFFILFPSALAFSLSSIFGGNQDDPHQQSADLMCYRGLKYFVGQEEIDDNVKCELNALEMAMPGMHRYCYKFTSHTGVTDFVKRGCSVVICSGLRNVCAKLEFEGVHGEMCCCSATSYCNSAPTDRRHLRMLSMVALFVLTSFCTLFWPNLF